MYRTIDARKSVPDSYIDTLVAEGLMTREDVMKIVSERMSFLAEQHKKVDTYVPKAAHLERQWSGLVQAPSSVEVWDTGVI
ncbi:probable 2-oxoglutarate dehydrogenase E1 component DHKTD1, mitochondrial [Penaeus monodon]|uniref:probable 2-oxoglutarate dehydrogenase E1 component DHKTD1, mitochondrial n=1 Tax=Penaeus monodon TaxID=6687 RepID=UPI0018A6DF78|nr:probable 2-oxoglutarate dehydrogenase E1 component DHKTD1, mitochondrial [Penaeus monodon]